MGGLDIFTSCNRNRENLGQNCSKIQYTLSMHYIPEPISSFQNLVSTSLYELFNGRRSSQFRPLVYDSPRLRRIDFSRVLPTLASCGVSAISPNDIYNLSTKTEIKITRISVEILSRILIDLTLFAGTWK